ncbi:hypothetical protein CH275_20750 [Rhodococcus sp. 06-235-1A]|nr:hypothetical protein CH275_20750 [Rhodococcus sp. 06-235-1A]
MSQDAAVFGAPPKSLADDIGIGLRPRRWVKEVLVLAAPVAAKYAMDVDGREAGGLDKIASGVMVLQLLAIAWIGVVGVAVYLA